MSSKNEDGSAHEHDALRRIVKKPRGHSRFLLHEDDQLAIYQEGITVRRFTLYTFLISVIILYDLVRSSFVMTVLPSGILMEAKPHVNLLQNLLLGLLVLLIATHIFYAPLLRQVLVAARWPRKDATARVTARVTVHVLTKSPLPKFNWQLTRTTTPSAPPRAAPSLQLVMAERQELFLPFKKFKLRKHDESDHLFYYRWDGVLDVPEGVPLILKAGSHEVTFSLSITDPHHQQPSQLVTSLLFPLKLIIYFKAAQPFTSEREST